LKTSSSEIFYAECLEVAKLSNVPFAVAGGYAVNFHTGIDRYTKDIDIFCTPGDFPRILNKFAELGYSTHVEDERWLAKIKRGDDCVDVIFGGSNAVAPITGEWIQRSHPAIIHNAKSRFWELRS